MRDIRYGIWLIALGITLFCAAQCLAEERPEKEWVRGGVATKSTNGQCLYRPFVLVGEIDDDDDGNSQIIGYEPGNVRVSRIDGKVIWQRVWQKHFARRGFPASGCSEKCPPYDE